MIWKLLPNILQRIFSLILDTSPPNITCPKNITYQTEPGLNYAVVNLTTPTAKGQSSWNKITQPSFILRYSNSKSREVACQMVLPVIDQKFCRQFWIQAKHCQYSCFNIWNENQDWNNWSQNWSHWFGRKHCQVHLPHHRHWWVPWTW